MQSPEAISQITSNLYLGGYAYNRDGKNTLVSLLKTLKITDIINCAAEVPNYLTVGDNISYTKHNWYDMPQFSLFPSIVVAEDHLNRMITANKRVYVHCYMGVSRSVSLVVFHLMKRRGWTYQQALFYVRQRRRTANPNPGFVAQLLRTY